MDHDRRQFLSLSALAPIIATLPIEVLLAPGTATAQGVRKTQRGESLPVPEDAESPVPNAPNADKVVLEHNQLQMKEAIDKLYALVGQLKQQVDRTDSTSVLSLRLVDSAKRVEDLAKQIRTLARD